MSQEQFARISDTHKAAIQKTGYLSPWSNMWVFPLLNDPAQYTNHKADNNLSVKFDPRVSGEPYFVANRDIAKGEELTNNYLEFDKIILMEP